MPSFNNLKDLEKYIKQKVKESSKELGKFVAEKTKEHIEKDVYESYQPSEYKRTFELKESIVSEEKDINNGVEITIEHDESMLHHKSIVTGEDVGSQLPYWIHEGKVPNIFNHNDYTWMHPRPYMNNTVEEFKNSKEHVKKLKEELKKKGIRVE